MKNIYNPLLYFPSDSKGLNWLYFLYNLKVSWKSWFKIQIKIFFNWILFSSSLILFSFVFSFFLFPIFLKLFSFIFNNNSSISLIVINILIINTKHIEKTFSFSLYLSLWIKWSFIFFSISNFILIPSVILNSFSFLKDILSKI